MAGEGETMANRGPDAGTMLDAAQAHALALAMYNAVAAQQQGAIVRQAATTMACTAMLSLGVAQTAESQPQPAAKEAAPHAGPLASVLAEALSDVPPGGLAADPAKLTGKVYQSVATSTALAIQDAADYLRSISTIVATVTGVAMAQSLANPITAEQNAAVIAAAQQQMESAIATFHAIGDASQKILKALATD